MKVLVWMKRKSSHCFARCWTYCALALLVVIVALAVFLPLSYKDMDLLERIGIAQLICVALTLFVILFGLLPVLRQLRISEARPRLSLAFDESGTTETTLEVPEGRTNRHNLTLWMTNSGNAVAKEFQVDLDVDKVFGAHFIVLHIGETKPYDPRQSADTGMSTLSFSVVSVPCFVGRPLPVMGLVLRTKEDTYASYQEGFRIPYRIYGTWGPEQSRELRVRFSKLPSA